MDSFRDLRSFPEIKDANDEKDFTQMIKAIKVRHNNVVPMMASGVQQLKKQLSPTRTPSQNLHEIHQFLDRFYMSRIGIRMLIGGRHVEGKIMQLYFVLELGGQICIYICQSSKDFSDMHSLIMHTYNLDNADLRVDHLGLHKALCVLMGWSYSKPPDNSKAYQFLSADEAAANRDDLVIWPPMVIIHNTLTGKNKEGRMEGLGNKVMDSKIREFGCTVGKSKSLYGREGHLGTTLIKFSSDQAGLKEANRLAEYFDRDNRGRRAWARLQPLTLGSKDDENNPHLMTFDERTREKKRIFYAYLGTASDLDKIDFETRKKVVIESQREYRASN